MSENFENLILKVRIMFLIVFYMIYTGIGNLILRKVKLVEYKVICKNV